MMRATLIALAATSALACSSYPAPTQRMATASLAARSAEAVGANSDPRARRHLQLAKSQIEEARREMSTGDNKRAEFLLVRAKADADLALAQTRESALETEARTALARVETLRTQVNQAQATGMPPQPPVGTTTTTGAPLQTEPVQPVTPSTGKPGDDKHHTPDKDMKGPRSPKNFDQAPQIPAPIPKETRDENDA